MSDANLQLHLGNSKLLLINKIKSSQASTIMLPSFTIFLLGSVSPLRASSYSYFIGSLSTLIVNHSPTSSFIALFYFIKKNLLKSTLQVVLMALELNNTKTLSFCRHCAPNLEIFYILMMSNFDNLIGFNFACSCFGLLTPANTFPCSKIIQATQYLQCLFLFTILVTSTLYL